MPADRVSIFRNQEKRNRPAFQEFFDQRFGSLATWPLTKQPQVSENHNLPYTFLWINPSHTQENRCPNLLLTQEPVPNSIKQTKTERRWHRCGRMRTAYCVRTKTDAWETNWPIEIKYIQYRYHVAETYWFIDCTWKINYPDITIFLVALRPNR